LNITAPITAPDLPKALKELKELKLAFVYKGDLEREAAKAKFLRSQGKPVPAKPVVLEPEEEKDGEEEGEERKQEEEDRVPEEKLRLVEKLIAVKRKQQRNSRRGQGGYQEEDEEIGFGEEGLDIDTYESRYAGRNKGYQEEEEEEEEVPLKGGRPPVEEVRGRGGRGRGGRRGGEERRGGY